jgi:hypothetical protein
VAGVTIPSIREVLHWQEGSGDRSGVDVDVLYLRKIFEWVLVVMVAVKLALHPLLLSLGQFSHGKRLPPT